MGKARQTIGILIAIAMLLRPTRPAVAAEPRTVNLLSLVDVDKDTVDGKWKFVQGALVGDNGRFARLRIPYDPPAEYDLLVEFVRTDGKNEVSQIIRNSRNSFLWQLGSFGNTVAGFSYIDGMNCRDEKNPSHVAGREFLKNGRKCTSLIQVRNSSVTAIVNGAVVTRCSIAPSRFSVPSEWSVGSDGLGFATCSSATTFISAKVIEISGRGRVLPHTGDSDQKPTEAPAGPVETVAVHPDTPVDSTPIEGPTSKVSNQQASIKALAVVEADSGMLGTTTEATLTATRGKSSKLMAVTFAIPVGNEMLLARDEAERFIRLTYPNWYADRAEITFEDKYNGHDGGSIGAAIGTMIESIIQGFEIDPDCAITGDISANGKVRAIGGVAAKLRGAIDAKCTLAAIPSANYDQLVDAVVYNGLNTVTDIQVIGISNLNDAVDTLRTSRPEKLAKAIALFGTVQDGIKNTPNFMKRKETEQEVEQVLELAPQHLSAKVLLSVLQGKQRKTLSATASLYYTSLAAQNMLGVLIQRDDENAAHQVPSAAIRTGLNDLRKLRPITDTKVRPLVDAWIRFIQAWNELQQGSGSIQSWNSQRQLLIDEMNRESTDASLMQKMLKEGI